MALSTWGLWSDELDEADLSQLIHSHLRRKRWEARLMATEIARLFGGGAAKTPTPGPTQVGGDDLFNMMGVTIKGG